MLAHHAGDLRRWVSCGRGFELFARTRVVAQQEVAARKLDTRTLVRGIDKHEALEREHALARPAGADGGDAEVHVERGVAEALRRAPPELVGGLGLAAVQERAQLLGRLPPSRQ